MPGIIHVRPSSLFLLLHFHNERYTSLASSRLLPGAGPAPHNPRHSSPFCDLSLISIRFYVVCSFSLHCQKRHLIYIPNTATGTIPLPRPAPDTFTIQSCSIVPHSNPKDLPTHSVPDVAGTAAGWIHREAGSATNRHHRGPIGDP